MSHFGLGAVVCPLREWVLVVMGFGREVWQRSYVCGRGGGGVSGCVCVCECMRVYVAVCVCVCPSPS
jgi:hypothetical protein